MYILKNALKSISRSKGRNLLIFLLVLAISVTSCIALSINHSADVAKGSIKDSLEVKGQITTDRTKLMQAAGNDRDALRELMTKSLSLDELKTFSTAESVKDFYYYSMIGLSAGEGIEPFTTEQGSNQAQNNEAQKNQNNQNSQNVKGQGGTAMPGGGMGGMNMVSMSRGDFTLTGYSSHNAMNSFINGTSKIVDGNMFDANDDNLNVIISKELATLNELNVGDVINLVNPNNEEETYQLTVSGIYTNEENNSGMDFGNASNVSNQMYLSYNSLNKIVNSSKENAIEVSTAQGVSRSSELTTTLNSTYVFTDVDNYEKFEAEAANLGLDTEIFTVTSSDVESYKQSLVPLENLSKYAMMFLLVVFIIGGLILVVFNLFAIRERKYEIGVLAAIGMKKYKVALQFITEVFVVTLVAIVIGAGIGAAASVPVADKMLESQVAAVKSSNETQNNNFGGNFQGRQPGGTTTASSNNVVINNNQGRNPGMTNIRGTAVEYIDSITASTNIHVLLELIGIGILLSILASSVGIISILRYEPLKILSNRA